MSQQLDKE
jgi:hypothetical protein